MVHATGPKRPLLPDLGRRPLIMGILNVTPDSFSDGGLFATHEAAVAQTARLVSEGADIVDVGGESTRPGHTEIPAEEEIARVIPVITAITARHQLPISIDTYKARTAEAAIAAGASIINDIWGLQRDPAMAGVAAAHGLPVIAMHNREAIDPALDIIADIKAFFMRTLELADRAGVPRGNVILDPGIGFGKTPAQNLVALQRLRELRVLGCPLLVGASRKSTIGLVTGRPAGERLAGSLAAHVLALANGADIIRVHDVAPHRDACRIFDAVQNPARLDVLTGEPTPRSAP
ncbi:MULTISPECIES: dihydropteroate synthase [unclassified Chelatococcus]|uniref:dihydropteroate synthase n=1 Tax=unclassified Chelatococcus TaxID=2638111 RepID=UPI001BCD769C|nr:MULTISPECIES: dihydropteroate synthase [unclassified Chelatococcus]MBS7697995.1 dihydropteroate synthase [Chelatococcus sp. YT9]MBX3556687.1 dihydropteroate synthase [Chelatococcus sp.]